MGGSRQRGWALVGLRSCSSWVGWVAGDGAGFSLGSLHVSFLGSWVEWVGRGQEAGLPLGSLHTSFLRATNELGSHGAPFMGRCQEAGLPLNSLHVSFFLGSWVGWVGRGQEAGLPLSCLGSLHVSFFLGPGLDGWAAAKKLDSHWGSLRSFSATKKLRFRWAPFIFPSFWAPGSDGWAAAKKLGSRWAPFILFGLLGADGWAAAKSWAPFMFPFWGVGSDGWATDKGLSARHLSFLWFWVRSCSRLGWMGRAHKAGTPMAFLRSQGCSHH